MRQSSWGLAGYRACLWAIWWRGNLIRISSITVDPLKYVNQLEASGQWLLL